MADGLGTTPGDNPNISMPPQVDDDFFDNLHTDQVVAPETPLPTKVPPVQGEPENKQPIAATEDQEKIDEPKGDVPPEPVKAGEPAPIVEPPPVTPAAPVADPELSPADNALVNAAPEAERSDLAARLKRTSFVQEFRNPERPAVEVVAEMEKLSPSRAAEVKRAVIQQSLSDPAAFARDLFSRDPELFGKVAIAIEDGHPDFWVKRHTGLDDATIDELRVALPFYRANKDRAELGPPTAPELLSDDELSGIEEFHPDITPKLKRILDFVKQSGTTTGLSTEEKAELTKLRAEAQVKAEPAKPDPKEAAQVADLELATRYEKTEAEAMSFVNAKLDDAVGGYGLKVTDEERNLAPDVANFKDQKRDIFLKGAGDMPSFEKGFEKFGEALTVKGADGVEKKPVLDIAKNIAYFVEHGEMDNAKEETRKLNPYIDQYLEQRSAHARIKWIDSQIQTAIAKTGKKPPVETFVPGATAAPSGKAQETYDDIMDNFVPTR